MNLVFIENNRPVTDSLMVSEMFNKEHARVLRDVRELRCSETFRVGNFAESTYRNTQGRDMPRTLMSEQGFMMLVMGYTGEKAFEIKEMYINEFNRMRNELSKPQIALPTFAEALEGYAAQLRITEKLDAEKRMLESRIQEDRPKVLFAESLQVSSDSILIGELAKLLKQNGIDIGQNRLFQQLRDDGYLMGKGDQYNLPTQRSMDLKIMEIKTGSRGGSDGAVHITRTTKVTGKGQIYFINKFKNQTALQLAE